MKLSSIRHLHTAHAPRRLWTLLTGVAFALGLGAIGWSLLALWQTRCLPGLSAQPSRPCAPLEHFVATFVALGFWVSALFLWHTRQHPTGYLFFLVVAGALATGSLTNWPNTGRDMAGRLFYVLLAWAGPLAFAFHLTLLDRALADRARPVRVALGAVAAVASLPALIWPWATLQGFAWFDPWRALVRFSFAFAFLLAALALIRGQRGDVSVAGRRRMRVITVGALCAFAPFLLLSMIPQTLGGSVYVPYAVTFPWLLLNPLADGYALFRRQLVRVEMAVGHGVRAYLLVILTLSAYLVSAALFEKWGVTPDRLWPLPAALLSVGLLLALAPLQTALQRLTVWMLYGAEVDYLGVVERIAHALSLTLDRARLEALLLDDLADALRLYGAALWLGGQGDTLSLAATRGSALLDAPPSSLPPGRLTAYLAALRRPAPHAAVTHALTGTGLAQAEQALVAASGVAWWLPLVSNGALQGLLLLGPKQGDDFFTAQDERVLATLAGPAGIAAHNARLAEQVAAGRAELAQAHRQALAAHERERQRLAHEVHDGAVQSLLALGYQLSQTQRRLNETGHLVNPPRPLGEGQGEGPPLASSLEAIRQGVLDVVQQLRALIRDLRPAGLDELGLSAALEGYVERLEAQGGEAMPLIELDLADDLPSLPNPVALCLFRAGQEALRNALKHADAQRITLHLGYDPAAVTLSVSDDGRGFRVPERLTELAQAGHFGLVGIGERAAWLGGQLVVRSVPGAGAEVAVTLPLKGGGEYEPDHSGSPGG